MPKPSTHLTPALPPRARRGPPLKLTQLIIDECGKLIRQFVKPTLAIKHVARSHGFSIRAGWEWLAKGRELLQRIRDGEIIIEQLEQESQRYRDELLLIAFAREVETAEDHAKMIAELKVGSGVIHGAKTEKFSYQILYDNDGNAIIDPRTGQPKQFRVKDYETLREDPRLIMRLQERMWPEDYAQPVQQLELRGGIAIDANVKTFDAVSFAEVLSSKLGVEIHPGEFAAWMLENKEDIDKGIVDVGDYKVIEARAETTLELFTRRGAFITMENATWR